MREQVKDSGVPIEEVGPAFADLRLKNRMTQADLAEKSDTSQVTISKLETSQRTPTLWVIGRLAKALGVTPLIVFVKSRARNGKAKRDG